MMRLQNVQNYDHRLMIALYFKKMNIILFKTNLHNLTDIGPNSYSIKSLYVLKRNFFKAETF